MVDGRVGLAVLNICYALFGIELGRDGGDTPRKL